MSQTIVAVAINLLSVILPKAGVTVGSEELTTTVTTIIAVVSALYIWVRRVKNGDVNALGKRK